MSHKQFIELIQARDGHPLSWRAAREGNPNWADEALRVAILTHVIDRRSMTALHDLAVTVDRLAGNAIRQRALLVDAHAALSLSTNDADQQLAHKIECALWPRETVQLAIPLPTQ